MPSSAPLFKNSTRGARGTSTTSTDRSSGLPSYSSRSKSPSGALLQLEYPAVMVLTESKALQAILQV